MKGPCERVGMATHIKRNGKISKRSVTEQLNERYFEVRQLLPYSLRTNYILLVVFIFISYCCHTRSGGMGGCNADSRVVILVYIQDKCDYDNG